MPTQFRIALVFKVVHLGRMWVVHLRANIDTVCAEGLPLILKSPREALTPPSGRPFLS